MKNINNEIVMTIAVFLEIGIAIATIVVMVIMLFRIYNINVFSKEGYLTMTLPVSSTQIVFSKLLISSLWIILTGIVGIIGMLIFIINMRVVSLGEIIYTIQELIQGVISLVGGSGILAIILMLVAMIVSIVKEIAKLFLACSIAHIKALSRFRIPVGILSYFLLSWLEVLIVQFVGFIGSYLPFKEELIHDLMMLEQVTDFNVILQHINLFNGVIVVSIVYALVLITAFAIGSVWILNNKLDLD